MNFQRLRYFLAMAEELHLGRAAERAHIEQSPLSRNLTLLEQELGVQLFIRTRHGTSLTPAGAELYRRARQLITEAERTRRAVAAIGGVRPMLRVGISDGLAQPRLTALFTQWHASEPDVQLRIIEVPAPQQHEELLTEHLEIGFSFGVANGNGLLLDAVWDEPVVVVLPIGHVLAQAQTLALADVLAYPLVLGNPRYRPGFRAQIDALIRPYTDSPLVAGDADSLAGTLIKVAAGCGLGFADQAQAQTLHRPDVVLIPVAEPPARLITFALTKPDREDELALPVSRLLQMAKSMP